MVGFRSLRRYQVHIRQHRTERHSFAEVFEWLATAGFERLPVREMEVTGIGVSAGTQGYVE
jgi:hypothetical protein